MPIESLTSGWCILVPCEPIDGPRGWRVLAEGPWATLAEAQAFGDDEVFAPYQLAYLALPGPPVTA